MKPIDGAMNRPSLPDKTAASRIPKGYFWGILGFSILWCWLAADQGIFWDQVLYVYKYSNHLFENGLTAWRLPEAMDLGAPLVFADYMAAGWMLFDKSLLWSHALMLPWVFGLLWQLLRLCRFFVERKEHLPWIFLLVCCDATLLASLGQISVEIGVVFFYFLAINSVLRQQKTGLYGALVFLLLLSQRSMMLGLSVFLFDLWMGRDQPQNFWKCVGSYALCAIPALAFLVWHRMTVGWWLSRPDIGYGHRSWADLEGVFRNGVVLVHRMADFGRLAILGALAFWLFRKGGRACWKIDRFKTIMILWLSSWIVVGGLSLVYKNPIGHRYFLATYLILSLALGYLLFERAKRPRLWCSGLMLCLLAGGCFLYPASLSQGWDSNFRYVPYTRLHHQMVEQLDRRQIPVSEVGTFHPLIGPVDAVRLDGDNRWFPTFSDTCHYALLSNFCNLDEMRLNAVKQHYKLVWRGERRGCWMEIYQK